MQVPNLQTDDIPQAYPAIERVLGQMRLRLNIPNHRVNDVPLFSSKDANTVGSVCEQDCTATKSYEAPRSYPSSAAIADTKTAGQSDGNNERMLATIMSEDTAECKKNSGVSTSIAERFRNNAAISGTQFDESETASNPYPGNITDVLRKRKYVIAQRLARNSISHLQ